jgi:hypothetical protein
MLVSWELSFLAVCLSDKPLLQALVDHFMCPGDGVLHQPLGRMSWRVALGGLLVCLSLSRPGAQYRGMRGVYIVGDGVATLSTGHFSDQMAHGGLSAPQPL